MKKHYVYELYNLLGTVEYVGETVDTKRRFNEHTKSKKGKFYKRTDININVVKEFDNKTDSFFYQCKLQKEYGLETDSEIFSKVQKGKPIRLHSLETKQKMSELRKGKPKSEEHKKKISQSVKARYSTTNS